MAGKPDPFKKELERAVASGDRDEIAQALAALAQSSPETPEGGDALFRLGLDAIFRKKDLNAAAEHLRAAAKVKGPHSVSARTALGLVLLSQGKSQQGVFELRKVTGTTPPTILSVSAWGHLHLALLESNPREAERAHTEHKRALLKLTESKSKEEAALAHFMLGMEHKTEGDRAPAKHHLSTAVASGNLPERERRLAEAALQDV